MTSFRYCLYLFVIVYFEHFACAAPGAGTIMISKKTGENLKYAYSVLIADHIDSSRGFASLGGKINQDEDPRDAAARETHEESRKQYDEREILSQINKARPIRLGDFTAYVILVPQIPEDELEFSSTDCGSCDERKAYKWIPVTVLDTIVKEKGYRIPDVYLPAGSDNNYLWEPFVEVYKAAIPEIRRVIANDAKINE